MRVVRLRWWCWDGTKVVRGCAEGEDITPAWAVLPDDGVQGFLLDFDEESVSGRPYRRFMYGNSWYFHTPEGVFDSDDRTSREEIERRYPGAMVKRGRALPDGLWETTRREIEAVANPLDPDADCGCQGVR